MFSRSIIDDTSRVIVNLRIVIDDYRVMLQLVASFTIIIHVGHIFIVQATMISAVKLFTSAMERHIRHSSDKGL